MVIYVAMVAFRSILDEGIAINVIHNNFNPTSLILATQEFRHSQSVLVFI